MPEPYHLPYDYARCTGELSTDPAQVWRADCRSCLRRLAPEHPSDPSRSQYIDPQPQPCAYHLPADD
jgi:hypothetical protein